MQGGWKVSLPAEEGEETREAGGTRWGRGTHGWERSLCVRPWMAFLYVLEDMVARRSTRFRSHSRQPKLCSVTRICEDSRAHSGEEDCERAMEMRGARGAMRTMRIKRGQVFWPVCLP